VSAGSSLQPSDLCPRTNGYRHPTPESFVMSRANDRQMPLHQGQNATRDQGLLGEDGRGTAAFPTPRDDHEVLEIRGL